VSEGRKRSKRRLVLCDVLTEFESEKSRWQVRAARWEDPETHESEPCVAVCQRRRFGPNGVGDKEFRMTFTVDELSGVLDGLRLWEKRLEGASRVA